MTVAIKQLPKFVFLTILYLLVAFPSLIAQSQETARPVETYDQLISAIRETMAESRERIEAAVEREKVREAWEIGKLIDEHVLYHQRAGYAEQVVARLAKDLGMGQSELYRMMQFARTYPIVAPGRKLSWAHYRQLIAVNEPEMRERLADRAEKEKWSKRDLHREIGRLSRPETEAPPVEKLSAQPGEVGTTVWSVPNMAPTRAS